MTSYIVEWTDDGQASHATRIQMDSTQYEKLKAAGTLNTVVAIKVNEEFKRLTHKRRNIPQVSRIRSIEEEKHHASKP